MPDDVERGPVEQRSKVDREAAAAGGRRAVPRRRRRRGGGGRAPVGGVVPCQRMVDRSAGGHVRHVKSPREGVDGGTSRLVGEAEQSEDAVRDGRTYCTQHAHTAAVTSTEECRPSARLSSLRL